jgi:hypothetical protein
MTGDAKLSFRPNQLIASFHVSTTSKDQVAARKSNDEKLAKFVRACRDAGVEQKNITLNEAGVAPDYRGNEVVGYTVNRSAVLIITDMARVDDALTAAVRNGGTQISAVVLQNTEHQAYETKARIAAAAVARERAKGVVEAVGGKLGLAATVVDRTTAVESVSAGNFVVPPEGPVSTSFASRELTVTSQVTVQFDIDAT